MVAVVVGTSLTPGGRVSHRGFIDVVDCLEGVRGWAVDLAALHEPPMLELLVGDVVVAEVAPDQARHDIAEALGTEVVAGFSFAPAVLAQVAGLAQSGDDVISVRVAGTEMALGIGDDPPQASEIIARLQQLNAPAKRHRRAADLELLLDDLRADAVQMAEQPLRAVPENHQGFIETLALDAAGQVWMIGWMKRGHLTEFAAVISERWNVPAAVALMTYAREDLPSDACGIIGLLSSSWRPSSAHSEFHLYFGTGGRFYLLAHVPVRLITTAELASEYEILREHVLGEGRAVALQRMLTALESWKPSRAAARDFGAETSIDSILVVPGLGCLAEGWLISPLRRVEGLRLRIGGAVLSAQPETISYKPRPDLLGAFPGSERLANRAGFVAMFAGDVDPEDFADPVLKVIFQGGASANWPIPTKVFRTLGHSATVEDALRFYPALEDEGFFPAFAAAAIDASLAGMTPLVPVRIARGKRVLVMVLPADRCDVFLLFEELAQQLRTGLDVEGVVLVASSSAHRADATWMFQEFARDTKAVPGFAASLVVVDEAAHSLVQLPDILREVGAQLFVFVGPGVFLTPSGWAEVRTILRGSGVLHFLALEPDDFDAQLGAHGPTARCFAWNTADFTRWSLGAANFLGGFHQDNGLLRANPQHDLHPAAARNSRFTVPTRVERAVNEQVYSLKAAQ